MRISRCRNKYPTSAPNASVAPHVNPETNTRPSTRITNLTRERLKIRGNNTHGVTFRPSLAIRAIITLRILELYTRKVPNEEVEQHSSSLSARLGHVGASENTQRRSNNTIISLHNPPA